MKKYKVNIAEQSKAGIALKKSKYKIKQSQKIPNIVTNA